MGANAPEDPELVMLLGMVLIIAIALLVGCVVLVIKGLRGEKNGKQKSEDLGEGRNEDGEDPNEENKDSNTEGK